MTIQTQKRKNTLSPILNLNIIVVYSQPVYGFDQLKINDEECSHMSWGGEKHIPVLAFDACI